MSESGNHPPRMCAMEGRIRTMAVNKDIVAHFSTKSNKTKLHHYFSTKTGVMKKPEHQKTGK